MKTENRKGDVEGTMEEIALALTDAEVVAPVPAVTGDRRSQLEGDIAITLEQINGELEVGKGKRVDRGGNRPARTNLILAKLDMQRRLLERLDAQTEAEKQTAASELPTMRERAEKDATLIAQLNETISALRALPPKVIE
jgi:hypothetical protein